MMRATLGLVVGVLIKAHDDLVNDPISEHYGIHPDPTPQLMSLAKKLGWTFDDIRRELNGRGVSPKWQYDTGIDHILNPECNQ